MPMTEVGRSRPTILGCSLLFLVLAAVAAWRPGLLGERFARSHSTGPEIETASATAIVHALALPWLVVGLFGLLVARKSDPLSPGLRRLAALAGAVAFIALANAFADWIVDDAAITFAYSENLANGHGLVLHPGGSRQEAYSNTLWMVILAGAHWLGRDVGATAKLLCVVCGAACTATAVRICADLAAARARFGALLLAGVVAVGSPFVVWSASGLEHALQALLLVAIVAFATFTARPVWPIAGCLAALMLLRPETPLMVAATFFTLALQRPHDGRRAVVALWPLLIVPGIAGAGLLAFRLGYFGVPFPNPYYAKASDATVRSFFNLAGASWSYVFGWLASSAAFVVVPLVALGIGGCRRGPVQLACALAAAQFAFVLYVGGDWMNGYRFIAPALPLVAVAATGALVELSERLSPRLVENTAIALAFVLGVATANNLAAFHAGPTTPAAVVASIGQEFVALAGRLGVDHPTLAHHDAGGTSWRSGIDLIDLGGLGDRAIGQHLTDPEFIRHYLFVERRPTFIFGSKEFGAAATGFYRSPEFAEQYVPVEFPGLDFMKSDLSHVRREVVREAPGLRVVREGGKIVALVVERP